jgi:FAD/FMN-containing dehydrogenase
MSFQDRIHDMFVTEYPGTLWIERAWRARGSTPGLGPACSRRPRARRPPRAWLEAEIGPVEVRVLRAVGAELDPTGVLNPGVLVP